MSLTSPAPFAGLQRKNKTVGLQRVESSVKLKQEVK